MFNNKFIIMLLAVLVASLVLVASDESATSKQPIAAKKAPGENLKKVGQQVKQVADKAKEALKGPLEGAQKALEKPLSQAQQFVGANRAPVEGAVKDALNKTQNFINTNRGPVEEAIKSGLNKTQEKAKKLVKDISDPEQQAQFKQSAGNMLNNIQGQAKQALETGQQVAIGLANEAKEALKQPLAQAGQLAGKQLENMKNLGAGIGGFLSNMGKPAANKTN